MLDYKQHARALITRYLPQTRPTPQTIIEVQRAACWHHGQLTLELPTRDRNWGVSINPAVYPLAARWLRQAVQYQTWRDELPPETIQAAHPLITTDTPERLFVEFASPAVPVALAVACALAKSLDLPLVYHQ